MPKNIPIFKMLLVACCRGLVLNLSLNLNLNLNLNLTPHTCHQITPISSIEFATFRNPAIFAPLT
jgi:hypothetical protein